VATTVLVHRDPRLDQGDGRLQRHARRQVTNRRAFHPGLPQTLQRPFQLRILNDRPHDLVPAELELCLRWLEKHEMEPGEETSIGLILCANKGEERLELLELDRSGIRVASYLTDLPPRQLLRRKLHETLAAAWARLEQRGGEDADMTA
jgi:hypothetical protein